MTKKLKKYSYRVMAYNYASKDKKTQYEVCACEVMATNEKSAIRQAKKMIKKKHYHVREARDYG